MNKLTYQPGHPTFKQMIEVAETLKSVLHIANTREHFDMGVGGCNSYNCGTTHCVGGWYLFAKSKVNSFTDYNNGAELMATDLGFLERFKLERWAFCNPSIWGNEDGISMFSVSCAYSSPTRPEGAKCLQDVIDHLIEVAYRLPDAPVQYADLRKELAVMPVNETPDRVLSSTTMTALQIIKL